MTDLSAFTDTQLFDELQKRGRFSLMVLDVADVKEALVSAEMEASDEEVWDACNSLWWSWGHEEDLAYAIEWVLENLQAEKEAV